MKNAAKYDIYTVCYYSETDKTYYRAPQTHEHGYLRKCNAVRVCNIRNAIPTQHAKHVVLGYTRDRGILSRGVVVYQ